jgi:hypothetical protein
MSTRFISRVTSVLKNSFTSKDAAVGVEATLGKLIYVPNAGVRVVAGSQGGTKGTVTGLEVEESGGDGFHRTKFIFTNMPLTVRNTEQGGGVKIYDFPDGYLWLCGAVGHVTITTTSVLTDTLNAEVACKWGVGTATQSTTSLTTTEQDLVDATAFTSSATINVANTATSQNMVTAAYFDGTTTAKDAYFNISVDSAGDIDADATVVVNGTVLLAWVNIGDYSLT